MKNVEIKKLRTGIFIDASNLLWSMKSKDSRGERMNYDICFEKLMALLHESYSPIFCNYYVCEDMSPVSEKYAPQVSAQGKFLKKLESFGYSLMRKPLKHIGSVAKCDTDVEIVVDMYASINTIDVIVLFSGDSDFKKALEFFHSQGKRVYVYAFRNFLAWELKDFAMRHDRCGYRLLDDLRGDLERL